MSVSDSLTSHADLIDRLGGGTRLAAALSGIGADVDRETIYGWRKRNRVPWDWRAGVAKIAGVQGVSLPADFLPGVAA